MMRSNIFDTHEAVKLLTAAGHTEKQAEVHTKLLADIINDQVATKQDLAEQTARIEQKMAESEMRLVKWILAAAGLAVAVSKLFQV
jgi:hypothetical protein